VKTLKGDKSVNPQKALWELLSAIRRGDRLQVDQGLMHLQELNKQGADFTVHTQHFSWVENEVYLVASKSNTPKV
jgi:hypothetical protein